MHKLREVIISITNRCNFKCRMCDIPQEKTQELTTDEWKKVIKSAHSMGALTVVFSGGEPLLREDIFDLISYVKAHSMNACLASNGYLVTEEVARKFKELGVNVVNISIEGPKKIHDYLRGIGKFERAIAALDNLRKAKVESTIAATVTKHNYRHLVSVVELAKKYGATTIKFQPFSSIFLSGRRGGDDFLIHDREFNRMYESINKVISSCEEYGIATNPRGYLGMIPFYLGRKHIDLNNGCAALQFSCPINSKGEVYPCWVLVSQDNLIGNVRNSNLHDIWNSAKHLAIVERIKNEGCPRCMMSCYDDNFGQDRIDRRVVKNLRQIRKKGTLEYLRNKNLYRRLKFYLAYRGSIKAIASKIKGALGRKTNLKTQVNRADIEAALKDIDIAKRILKEKINNVK